MNPAGQIDNLVAGAVQGAECLAVAASNLARDRTLDRSRQLLNQAIAFAHGAELLHRALIAAKSAAIDGAV